MTDMMRHACIIALLLAGLPARAAPLPALYQATAIVTGTDMRQRPLGFAECLTEVLVKVSGRPSLRDDARVAALALHADTLVQDYDYVDPQAWRHHHDDQGTYDRSQELTVRFVPARVDAALAALGVAPWTDARPLLEPIILIRPVGSGAYLLSLTAPAGADLRATVVREAAAYGLGVHIPTETELGEWAVVPFGFPAPLDAPGTPRLRVTGELAWDVKAMGWVGTWRATVGAAERSWQIRGVGYDAAIEDMVRGAVSLAHPGS
jgi:hypothetical protein